MHIHPLSNQPVGDGPSQEIFRLLVDAVDEYAIFAMSVEGIILTWNAGGQRLKGYTPEEVIGQSFTRFYTQVDIDRNHPANELRLAALNGKYEEEGWRVKKDGSTFWANVVVTALKDENGILKGFGKVTRDLTGRRQAEEALRQSEERYRLLVDNIKDYAILFLDSKGRITSWNIGAGKITGYNAKEILGSHVSKFYTNEDRAAKRYENELTVAAEEGRYEEEGRRVRKDGTIYWAHVVITSVKDKQGNLLGFSKVTRDLTDRKRAEDALREAYGDLELRIEERTRELSEAKARAESAVKIRDNFFSMASHELKTPLSSLKMQAQLRKRNVRRGSFSEFAPDKLIELCNEDERQVERLSFLVDNMLDISKLTAGALLLTFEQISLNELVQDVANRMQPLLSESGNVVSVVSKEKINGLYDRYRIEQVFTNLLSNTGKYAPGKPVEMEIAISDDRNSALISVKDLGRGISEKDQKRILNPYERVSDNGQTSGLGLGLYITRQIIEAHGGEFAVRSQLDEGSTFIVKLPLHRQVKE